MSLDICNDRLFCNYNVSNSKPFYIIFNTIPKETDITNNYSDYSKLLDGLVENSYSELVSLYTKPPGTVQHKYICIGQTPVHIRQLLDSLERDGIANISNGDWNTLDIHFNYSTKQEWKLTGYSKIKFLDIVVSRSDTIQVLKYICGGYLDEQYSTELDNLFIFSDKTIDSEQLANYIRVKVEHDLKNLGGTVSIEIIKGIFLSYGVPSKVLENAIESLSDSTNIVNHILENDMVFLFIKLFFRFKPIDYQFYRNLNKINQQVPVDCYIYNYFSGQKDYIYNIDITKQAKIDKSPLQYTIEYDANPIENSFYIYSLENIVENIDIYIDEATRKDSIFKKNLFNQSIAKLFPNKTVADYYKPALVSKDKQLVKDQLEYYQKIANIYFEYSRKKQQIIEQLPYTIKIVNCYYLQIQHRVSLPTNIDLLTIFNYLKLSYEIPFVKMRDSSTKDMVYKIFKPITQRQSIQYRPPVSKEELENWISYHGYELQYNRVKHIKSIPREICYKLRLLDVKQGIPVKGQIFKLNKDSVDILYDELVTENIPYHFIVNYSENKPYEIGEIVDYYIYKTVYADIELSKNGKMSILIDTSPIDIESLDDIVGKFIDKVNGFITWLFSIDQLKDFSQNHNEIVYRDLYVHSKISKTNFSNFTYKYSIDLPENYIVSYSDLYKTSQLCSPFIIINNATNMKGEEVEYYDIDRAIFIKAKVTNFNVDGTYNLVVYDPKAGINMTEKRENVSGLLVRKDKQSQSKTFDIIYRRVPEFNTHKPLENLIITLNKSGANSSIIVDRVMKTFELDKETALTQINIVLEKAEVETIDRLGGELGINIKIDFSAKDNVVDVYIDNIKTLNYTNSIYDFLEFFFNMYFSIAKVESNSIYKSLLVEKQATPDVEIIRESQPINILSNNVEKQDKYDEFLDIDDLGIDLDDLDSYEVEEKKQEEPVRIEVVEDRDSSLENQKRLDRERILSNIVIEPKVTETNAILTRLYKNDPELFLWQSDNKKGYSMTCQGVRRYPKILTDSEKQKVDQRDSEHKKTHSNFIGSYSGANNQVACQKESLKTKVETNVPYNCNAVKFGTNVENKRWYICPKIYDLEENVPVSIYDLQFETTGFEPIDFFNGWRTNKTDGRDILEFGPSYKGRKPILKDRNIVSNKSNSLVLLSKDSSYYFPGFLNAPHPKGYYVPCCFETSNKKIVEAFAIKQKVEKQENVYIQAWGKGLGYKPYRIGLLPDKLNQYLGNTQTTATTGELGTKIAYFRRGIKQDYNTFLSLIANIKDDIYTDRDLVEDIIKNITYNEFQILNNGNLELLFRGAGENGSFQNYLEYILSSEPKDYKFFYDYLTRPHKWLFPEGLNLILLEHNAKGDIDILCPYFCQYRASIDAPVALAIKYGEVIEPIYYFKSTIPDKKFKHTQPYIELLYKLFSNNCKTSMPSKLVDMAYTMNKQVFTKKDNYKTVIERLTIVSKESIGYKPKYLLTDSYNKCIGIYLENGFIVPIYPSAIEDTNTMLPTINISIKEFKKISLEQFLEYSHVLKQKSNGSIHVEIVKYFRESSNSESIIGVLTNSGIYIPIERSTIDNSNSASIDYSEVDRSIRDFEKAYKKLFYKNKISYSQLLELLEGIKNKYKQQSHMANQYMPEKALVKSDNQNIVTAIITHNHIIIPISDIEKSEINLPVVKHFSIDNYTGYIDKSVELSRLSNYRIPISPVRAIMDKDKRYTTLVLECDYKVDLSDKEQFNILKKRDTQYLISYLLDNPIVDRVFGTKVLDTDNIFIDKRIQTVEKLNYIKNIYELVRYELNQLLHVPTIKEVLEFVSSVLNYNAITTKQKYNIVYPMLRLLIDYIITIEAEGENTRYPTINLDNPCNSRKGECSTNAKLCKITSSFNYKEIDSEHSYIRYLYNKYSDSEVSPDILEKILKNISSYEVKHIKKASEIYMRTVDSLKKLNRCRVILYDSIDGVRLNSIINRIVDEMIRNSYKREQVLKVFSRVNLNNRYKTHEPYEVLIDKEDMEIEVLNNLYVQIKKKYYSNLTPFEEIQGDYSICVEKGNTKDVKDSCALVNGSEYSVVRKTKTKRLLNPSKKTNIVKLTDQVIVELDSIINRLNTPLTRCDIGESGEYRVVQINKKKTLAK